MGILSSRQLPGAEEADVVSNHAYKYPPRSGNYFGTHFIMGGERFDTPQPEAYLFGENTDLNFLGSRPTPFPYPPPQPSEPTKTLKSLVNIRKESVKFVRCTEAAKLADDGASKTQYNIEFTFDCDARCAITVYYFCTEDVTANGAVYTPRDASMASPTFYYRKGANQQFCQSSHVFDPSRYPEEDLSYNLDREIIPIAIHCVVEEGTEVSEQRQSHTTICVVERHSDGTHVLKALKQKLFVDGLCYLLQEIYGIENKNIDTKPSSDEETEDGGSECVICMSEVRDTLILPCRHLCLCNSCADSLRYQANNCPICRAPFRALLQIRALQKISGAPTLLPASPPDGSMENIPAGYEPVSLIEALNGPCPMRVSLAPPPASPAAPHAAPDAAQAAEALNRSTLERTTSVGGSGKRHAKTRDPEAKSPRDRALAHPNAPEFRMSVLLAREEESAGLDKAAASSPLLHTNILNGVAGEKRRSSEPEADYEVEDLEAETEVECADGDLEAEGEGDSEQERLSPLLTQKIANGVVRTNGATPSVERPSLQHIDDTDTDDTAAHTP